MEEVIVPKTVEETHFFTATFSKAQVWELWHQSKLVQGEDWILKVVAPATTLNS